MSLSNSSSITLSRGLIFDIDTEGAKASQSFETGQDSFGAEINGQHSGQHEPRCIRTWVQLPEEDFLMVKLIIIRLFFVQVIIPDQIRLGGGRNYFHVY